MKNTGTVHPRTAKNTKFSKTCFRIQEGEERMDEKYLKFAFLQFPQHN